MATAETARLVASLELQDKNFTRGIRNVERGVGRVDKKLSAFGGFVNRNLARGIDSFAANLVGGVFAGVESLKELEQQEAQTAAVIKSTGQAAGISAEEVTRLAEKYEGLNAIIGDEVIRSGENMLLTFTNIHKDAFEPALQAVLDMNTAMGKGPEGLTSTAIQVGKALNDPTTGLTALRKVGVAFTKDQQKKIKSLQKEGKLYEAQQIILAELNKEFSGSFAAQGDTTAGKVAKFHDAVEDLQRTFAKALLPIIVKVADKLGTFLGDPAVVTAIEEAGETLGRVFDEILSAAERLPWKEIGQGLSIAATGAKGILNAFLAMPSWVQAVLIGGFAVNKISGGLLGDIFKGVLGIKAGIVHVNGPIAGGGAPVAGGGAAAGAGKVARFANAVKILGAVTIAGASIALLAQQIGTFVEGVGQNQADLQEKVNATTRQGFKETVANLQATSAGLAKLSGLDEILASVTGGGQITQNFEMAADRIVKAQGLTRSETVAALNALSAAQTQARELNLKTPTLDAAIRTLMDRLNTGQQATTNAINNAKSIASRENSAQKAELGNIKATTQTGLAQQKAALVAQTAVNVVGNIGAIAQSAREVLAQAGTTSAVNSGAAATRGVAPPIVGAVYAIGSQIASTIVANRPVIQSTNVVNNYTSARLAGSRSGSRASGTGGDI